MCVWRVGQAWGREQIWSGSGGADLLLHDEHAAVQPLSPEGGGQGLLEIMALGVVRLEAVCGHGLTGAHPGWVTRGHVRSCRGCVTSHMGWRDTAHGVAWGQTHHIQAAGTVTLWTRRAHWGCGTAWGRCQQRSAGSRHRRATCAWWGG